VNVNSNLGLINTDNLFYVSSELVMSPKYHLIAINNTGVLLHHPIVVQHNVIFALQESGFPWFIVRLLR